MSQWPAPTGKPVAFALATDPWAEQARRHEQHRLQQRRRRRRSLRIVVAAVVLVGAGGTAFVAVQRSDTPAPSAAAPTRPSQPATAESNAVVNDVGPGAVTDSVLEAASVDEVWLLDRGDGNFDWGSVLSSTTDVLSGDLAVSVVVFDADANEVFTAQISVPQLAPDGVAAVGGTFRGDATTTARIEVTATPGVELPDATAAEFAVSNVRRVSAGQVDSDDRLLGSVELTNGERGPIRLAALWRDADGDVIASVFSTLDAVEVGESADFSLRLPRTFVPPGEPDTVMAMVGAPS